MYGKTYMIAKMNCNEKQKCSIVIFVLQTTLHNIFKRKIIQYVMVMKKQIYHLYKMCNKQVSYTIA